MSFSTKPNIAFGPSPEKGVERMKPPHSYIALIATAILSSPEKKLTLTEINEYLVKNYAFFRGSYQGWKNSVRHNLSFNKCFVKILRDSARPWGKDNLWAVSDLHDYLLADGSFRRRRRRKPKKDKKTEEPKVEKTGKTTHKKQNQEHGIEDQGTSTARFPVLQSQTTKQNSKICKGAKHAKVSTKKFSGPFSIESILAAEKPTTKRPLEKRGSNEFTPPAVIAHEDSFHSHNQLRINETDPYRTQEQLTLSSRVCHCGGVFMGHGDVYGDIYLPNCLRCHHMCSCNCNAHAKCCL